MCCSDTFLSVPRLVQIKTDKAKTHVSLLHANSSRPSPQTEAAFFTLPVGAFVPFQHQIWPKPHNFS